MGDSSGQRPDTFLYPYALQVPGIKHILDWIIRDALSDLEFWPIWQSAAKRLVQWFHGQTHRDLVVKLLGSLGHACSGSVDVMQRSVDSDFQFCRLEVVHVADLHQRHS